MDYQAAFNLALSAAAFMGGFLLNKIWAAIERLDNEARSLPVLYVSKTDYREDIAAIKAGLAKIYDKLESKMDKNHDR